MIRALVIAWLLLAAAPAWAGERYAIIVGNNAGAADDVELRYAHDDAKKMFDVLTTLGEFPAENVTLLAGRTADDVRRALITVNDRLRTRAGGPDSMLVFYYSGHATADELRLGRTGLPLAQLESLVRGSAATMRIMILDSCRSGALTRVKGGVKTAPVQVALDDRLAGEGVVFMTSSTANEDAQESDELRGSFFTHHLVSALLGSGDTDGDGAISLGEAYRTAYDSTVRASSRTLTLQHPTFHYDVRGRGDIVLTRMANGPRRATLVFPADYTFLVFRNDRDGRVVAELGKLARTRAISVEPGRYFVRGRGTDFAIEGPIEVSAAATLAVDASRLRRIEYARLVRKGWGPGSATALRTGYAVRSALVPGESPCHGAFGGVARSYRTWSFEPRLSLCEAGFANRTLDATTREVDAEFRLGRPVDLGPFTLEPSIVAGGSLVRQTFTTAGMAPPRTIGAGHLGVAATLVLPLGRGVHAAFDVTGEAYLFARLADGSPTTFVGRIGAGLGTYF